MSGVNGHGSSGLDTLAGAVPAPAPFESTAASLAAKRPRASVVEVKPAKGTPAKQDRSGWWGRAAVAPHLWPERAKKNNTKIILRAIADFLKRVGYWPTKAEIANRLATTVYAVDWYVFVAQESGWAVLHGGKWKERRRIELTDIGWAIIGRGPVTPFKSPPGKQVSERRALAEQIAADVEKLRAKYNPGEAEEDVDG